MNWLSVALQALAAILWGLAWYSKGKTVAYAESCDAMNALGKYLTSCIDEIPEKFREKYRTLVLALMVEEDK